MKLRFIGFGLLLSTLFFSCFEEMGTTKPPNIVAKPPPIVSEKKLPQPICKESTNQLTQLTKPIVVMVSIDGFRADYIQKFQPKTLLSIIEKGIYTKALIPSYPTLTFPNHYTLVTGRYPGNHGIVSNIFYDTVLEQTYNAFDSSAEIYLWYKGDPIWNVAEKQGMIAHTYDWVGSAANVNRIGPTCYTKYDGSIEFEDKINSVITSLSLPEDKRPHFIALYTADIDNDGHKYGPDSKEVKTAVEKIDTNLSILWNFIQNSKLPINLIVVSDHGMQSTDINKIIYLQDIIGPEAMRSFKMSDRGGASMLYIKDPVGLASAFQKLKETEKNYKVYLKSDAPVEFHMTHPTRTGDIIIVPDIPYYVKDFRPLPGVKESLKSGNHGWSYENPEMHALFVAAGYNIEKNELVPEFKNIDVYPFLLNLLDIKTDTAFDGDPETLKKYIKNK